MENRKRGISQDGQGRRTKNELQMTILKNSYQIFFRCANQESPKKLNLREHSQGGNACACSIKSQTMVTP